MNILLMEPGTLLAMRPVAGSDLDSCINEAKNLAKILKGNVKFTHNNTTYQADSDGNCIKIN